MVRFCCAVRLLSLPVFVSSVWGSIRSVDTSPNELIAAGKYQLAADALVDMIQEAGISGLENENRAALMSNLGLAYEKLGRYAEAETTLKKAIQSFRRLGFVAGTNYGRALNNLATVYLDQKRYAKAEAMFQDALALHRKSPQENDPDIALVLNNLGLARLSTGSFSEAEEYFRASLELQRKIKENSSRLAVTLNNLALTYKHQKRFQEAVRLYSQAIEEWNKSAQSGRPEIAIGLQNLASMESLAGEDDAAEKHFQEAMSIAEAALPPEHPNRTAIMSGYASLLAKLGRKQEAKQLESSARVLRAKHAHENYQDLTVDVRQLAR
jgi:tetratricopeptide (TPR) repeat protein